jgi:hypothetical protein
MKKYRNKERIGYNLHFQEGIYGAHLMLVISETIGYSFIINLKKPVGYSNCWAIESTVSMDLI